MLNTLNYLVYMTVHSVSCIVALSKAAVIGYPTGYRHTCIHTPVYPTKNKRIWK